MCSPSSSQRPALARRRKRSTAVLSLSFCGLAFFVNSSSALRMPSGVRSNFTAVNAACSFSCGVFGLAGIRTLRAAGGVPLPSGAIIGRGILTGRLRAGFGGAPGFTLIAGVMIVLGVGLAGAWPSVMNGSALQPNSRRAKRRIITVDFLFSVKKSRLASAALVRNSRLRSNDQEPLPSGRLPTLAPRASSFFFMSFGLLLFFWPWHFEQTFLLP